MVVAIDLELEEKDDDVGYVCERDFELEMEALVEYGNEDTVPVPLNADNERGEGNASDSDSSEGESPGGSNDLLMLESAGGSERGADTEAAIDPRKGSLAWEHFKEVMLPTGKKMNKCIHCSKLLSVKKRGTTSHLVRHLKESCTHRSKLFTKKGNEDTRK